MADVRPANRGAADHYAKLLNDGLSVDEARAALCESEERRRTEYEQRRRERSKERQHANDNAVTEQTLKRPPGTVHGGGGGRKSKRRSQAPKPDRRFARPDGVPSDDRFEVTLGRDEKEAWKRTVLGMGHINARPGPRRGEPLVGEHLREYINLQNLKMECGGRDPGKAHAKVAEARRAIQSALEDLRPHHLQKLIHPDWWHETDDAVIAQDLRLVQAVVRKSGVEAARVLIWAHINRGRSKPPSTDSPET